MTTRATLTFVQVQPPLAEFPDFYSKMFYVIDRYLNQENFNIKFYVAESSCMIFFIIEQACRNLKSNTVRLPTYTDNS